MLKQLSSFLRRLTGRVIVGSALFALPAMVQAQDKTVARQDTSSSSDGTYVLRSSVTEVLLYCAVLDSKGTVVTGLDQSWYPLQRRP